MASVFDVAQFILQEHGEMTAMKLQKLVYYSQAWSLVWDEAPLFSEPIEAWANGPVTPELYRAHRGRFIVNAADFPGDIRALTTSQCETISSVLEYYGNKSPQWLSDLTHLESPWKDAREGLSANARGNSAITHDAMAEYYGSLPPDA